MNDNQYIDLLKKVLIDYHRMEMGETPPIKRNKGHKPRYWLLYLLERILKKSDFTIREKVPYNKENRLNGRDWPAYADSMIGLKRMDNIEFCVNDTIKNNIPGDLIETGVWRGGSVIFMRALLKVAGVTDKIVWVADSFEGLPKPDEDKYAADKGDDHYTYSDVLAISEEQVKYNRGKDYWPNYANKIKTLTLKDIQSAATKVIQPAQMTWLIVGDRKKIEKSIRDLNLGEIHFINSEGKETKTF